MIVYGVQSGEYSDYRVHCMFVTEELAEQFVSAWNLADGTKPGGYGSANVQPFAVFDRAPTSTTWWSKRLTLYADGSWPPHDLEPRENIEWEFDAPRGLTRRADVEILYSGPSGPSGQGSSSIEERPGVFSVDIQSLDRDAVAKTTSDLVARWKMQGFTLHGAKPWV